MNDDIHEYSCLDCGIVFRIEFVDNSDGRAEVRYCPSCSGHDIRNDDTDAY